MKGGTQAALAIGVGYLLGRRRRMRMATMLAAAAATGSASGIGGMALRRGAKMIGSTDLLGNFAPQIGEIAETVRGDLLVAGKAAAAAAVNNRLESLTDSLHDRAQLIRDPAAAAGEAGEAVSEAGDTARRTAGDTTRKATGTAGRRRRRPPEDVEEIEDEDTAPADEEEEPADVEDEQEPADVEDEDADEEPEPAPRRRPARRSAPVARARR